MNSAHARLITGFIVVMVMVSLSTGFTANYVVDTYNFECVTYLECKG